MICRNFVYIKYSLDVQKFKDHEKLLFYSCFVLLLSLYQLN